MFGAGTRDLENPAEYELSLVKIVQDHTIVKALASLQKGGAD
jgi:hypothetical protein